MLPTTPKKVWLFWITTTLGILTIGLWKLGMIHLSDGPSGFIQGFTLAFFISSIVVSAHYFKTSGDRA